MKKILPELFLVAFGFTFSFMLSSALRAVYGGVGLIYSVGIWGFCVRSAIVGTTFAFCGIYFVHAYRFIKSFPDPARLLPKYYQATFVMFLSTGSWLAYHAARIVCRPLAADIYEWHTWYNNVDVIFAALFGLTFLVLRFGLGLLVHRKEPHS